MNKIILFYTVLFFMNTPTTIIFDFTKNSAKNSWRIVDDVVMGGKSQSDFIINDAGNGVFYGKVSLENNGGFSSVRHRSGSLNASKYTKIVLSLKGDGKSYQFRIKDKIGNYYSYVQSFETTNQWQKIVINLSEMYPTFRGRKLNMPNFSSTEIQEIAILIGNKKNESFKLELDKIYFE